MNYTFHLPYAVYRYLAAPLIGVMLLFTLISCGDQNSTVEQRAQDTSAVQDIERNLTFNDVTLEQADAQGRPIWIVKAKQATYSKDRRVAQVENPSGDLFQDGKSVYQITAKEGEIEQDGEQLFLKGQIVATDPRNKLVLRGNELEWRPKEDLLIVRNQLTGSHPQVQAVAQEARVFSRTGRIELQGKVEANTSDPVLQMRTEHLIWQIREQKLIGDRPLEIDRYKDKKITDRATANQGEVDLKTKIATMKQNAQLALLDPPMQVTSNSMIWNMNTEIVTTDQPVRLVNRQRQITVTANQGRMDTQKEVAYLNGDVNGIGQRGQSLKSKELTWYLPSQLMEANGDVFYRQVDPPVSFKGQKAVGNLQEQNIVVSGGRVLTEIIPQPQQP
ncbi:LPS export ABC transporter periplasmic protein LptC [Chroococcidiopsis sp. CCMEE 29]|uniref:LPS export ABC transporter periplasmic protein LptC n=1 Tax=Chroococcidiopsis sp. CCMEE 29 TaxID=155894 RepID=UPI00202284CF|nr:LPS export ABC transporter periplasmic protein LptC [Chroococcidiopsis sp. CCMEE 29]